MPSPTNLDTTTTGHDLIVIGASAGGVEALLTIVRDLPVDLPAAICVVLHLPPTSPSRLPHLLTRAGPLPATHAENGEPLELGHIYVAPPDYHLLVRPGHLELSRGPRENRSRPAIDALFRSAALAYGRRVVGVVLSGALDDGTAGLLAVKQGGGLAVVQDPDDALFDGMPRNAIERVNVDVVAPGDVLAPLLARLASTLVDGNGGVPATDQLRAESTMTDGERSPMSSGPPRAMSAPL